MRSPMPALGLPRKMSTRARAARDASETHKERAARWCAWYDVTRTESSAERWRSKLGAGLERRAAIERTVMVSKGSTGSDGATRRAGRGEVEGVGERRGDGEGSGEAECVGDGEGEGEAAGDGDGEAKRRVAEEGGSEAARVGNAGRARATSRSAKQTPLRWKARLIAGG